MYFKISARELEVLESERETILRTLRNCQKSKPRGKPMKPPILVVPLDATKLVCIIEDLSEDEDEDEAEVERRNSRRRKSSTRRRGGNWEKSVWLL